MTIIFPFLFVSKHFNGVTTTYNMVDYYGDGM